VRQKNSYSGFSIVEVMAAMVIAGVLLIGIMQFVATSQKNEVLIYHMIDFKALASNIAQRTKIQDPIKCGLQFTTSSGALTPPPFSIAPIPLLITTGAGKRNIDVAGVLSGSGQTFNGNYFQLYAINSLSSCSVNCSQDLYLLMFEPVPPGEDPSPPVIKKVAALKFTNSNLSCGPAKILTGWTGPTMGVCQMTAPGGSCPQGQYIIGYNLYEIQYHSLSSNIVEPISIFNFICCPAVL
jgi:Tfp pilus assembly protein PilV